MNAVNGEVSYLAKTKSDWVNTAVNILTALLASETRAFQSLLFQQQRNRRPAFHFSLDVVVASSQVAVTTQSSLGQRKLSPQSHLSILEASLERRDMRFFKRTPATSQHWWMLAPFFSASVQFAQRVWDQAGRHRPCGWLMVDDAIRRGCAWETTRALQTPRQLQLCHP